MLRQQGGDHVKAGFYLNLDSWEIRTISGGTGATLEGTSESGYLRVPVLGMLLFAPLMGALFAMFLPFIGIALVMQFAAGKARHGAKHVARQAVAALGPSWQPSTAHLTGTPDAPTQGTAAATTDAQDAEARLDALEQEIKDKAAR